MYFKIHTPKIVSEVLDGEAIILNLESGNYYSLQSIGAVIWDYIAKGYGLVEIIQQIQLTYDAKAEDIETAVKTLVEELQLEQLIIASDQSQIQQFSQDISQVSVEKLVFQIPLLQKYSDMQDLLILDPIHEVDEAGWPSRPVQDAHYA
jgi:hypothetical protein